MEWNSDLSSGDSTAGQLDPEIRALLKVESVNAFYRMSGAQRRTVLRRSLVRNDAILFDPEKEEDVESANAALLRPGRVAHLGETAQQLAMEAQTLHYGENCFVVRLGRFWEFVMDGLYGEKDRIDVAPLVGAITVDVSLHDDGNIEHVYAEDSKYDKVDEWGCAERRGEGKLALWTQRGLRKLQRFSKARKVLLRLRGDGMPNGSDLATQQTIRDIAVVVGELLEQFGDRLDIVKMVEGGSGGRENREQSIRSYWDKPGEAAKQRVMEGKCSFVDHIQVKVEEWIQVGRSGNVVDI